jgi:hypothetical protein
MLRGGHYPPFGKYNKARRGLARPNQAVPFTVEYQGAPCVVNPTTCSPLPPPALRAKELEWTGDNKWEKLFKTLGDTGCNILRAWVMGGTPVHPPQPGVDPNTDPPFDLFPFVPARKDGEWKWKVYHAVEQGVWNTPFFDRLADFAEEADARGVCLQLSLFNYFDLDDDTGSTTFKTWSQSPWNPTKSFNPPDRPNWGNNHLVKGATPRDRNAFFITPTNALRNVQQALVRKIVTTLKGRGNVIFEVMNEPRLAPYKDMAVFNSEMIGAINAAAGNDWTPLISVNATRPPNDPEFDTDWWREHSTPGTPDFVPNYDRVDVISYHGMTGFNNFAAVPGCNRTFSVPPVDPANMQKRITKHKEAQQARPEKKSLLFCTDAARIDALEHKYCDPAHPAQMLDMHVRDGQIDTHYGHTVAEAPGLRALKSDLRNWAYWFTKRAVGGNLGLVHLQNHSGFESSFHKILKGYQEATTPTAQEETEPDA